MWMIRYSLPNKTSSPSIPNEVGGKKSVIGSAVASQIPNPFVQSAAVGIIDDRALELVATTSSTLGSEGVP